MPPDPASLRTGTVPLDIASANAVADPDARLLPRCSARWAVP
ncbi:MAG: hypothetical protein ACLVJH_13120 [Faecalibacterium prausnitzii]